MKLPKSRRLCKFDPDRLTKSSRFGKSNPTINSVIYPVRSIALNFCIYHHQNKKQEKMKKQLPFIILTLHFLLIATVGSSQKKHGEDLKVKSSDTIDTREIPTHFPIFEKQLDSIEQFVITTPVKPKNRFQLFMLGEHHQPVYLNQYQFPVLDLSTYKGGLRILKKGGGKQTNSLRLATADNKEYVMRSITKDV